MHFHLNMPNTICSRAAVEGLLEWIKVNCDAICFTRLEPTEKPALVSTSCEQDVINQLQADIYYDHIVTISKP